MKRYYLFAVFIAVIAFNSCREDNVIFTPEVEDLGTPEYTSIQGFYLLNEGNMGSNTCTLDYFDYAGKYTCNIFPTRNPEVVKELGDVGNDLQIYGSIR